MTNIPHLIETALLLLIAFLIGCIIGYLLRARIFGGSKSAPQTQAKTASADAKSSASAQPAAASAAAKPAAAKPVAKPAKVAVMPEKLNAPRDGKKDNLKLIKGVGPKIEGKLNDMGIFHFEQIAVWDKAEIAKFDEQLSFKGRIDRERWVPQAKALAKK